MLRRTLLGLALLSGLAACGAEPIMATSEEVQKAAFSPNEPPYMTLITVISNENGSGGHTGLIINASQRVVWDPAGTWYHPWSPEQNDVHFGITDYLAEHYVDYHARETFHVVTQKVPVSRQVAEMALAATRAYGAVPKGKDVALLAADSRQPFVCLLDVSDINLDWDRRKLFSKFGEESMHAGLNKVAVLNEAMNAFVAAREKEYRFSQPNAMRQGNLCTLARP